MRRQYKLCDNLNSVQELQDYVIARYAVDYQIVGKTSNHPAQPDFGLCIAYGDDCATHFEIYNKAAVKLDERLQELLADCSKFRPQQY